MMKPQYACIQETPSGRSLPAIRKDVREKMRNAKSNSSMIKLDNCNVYMEAETFRPVLLFKHGDDDFAFYLDRAWFKKAKRDFEGLEAILRQIKTRDCI
jgi:hypothetical protein